MGGSFPLAIYLLSRKGRVEPMILISGSRPLAIPSRVISCVNSKARLPSNLMPCVAEIVRIAYIVVPTLMSGTGRSCRLMKKSLSLESRDFSISGAMENTAHSLIALLQATLSRVITEKAN